MTPSAVALIPARGGSLRVPGKNTRLLAGHPLIAYSIAAARESGCFDAIVCSTDDQQTAEIAERYGAEVPGLRPAELATATSPDVDWIRQVRDTLSDGGRTFELFSILRPTSPFRTGATIRRALDVLLEHSPPADSVRAVELCRQHPGKMWVLDEPFMRPLLDQPAEGVPMHSSQYQALPPVYVQNSSLEIAWTRVLDDPGDIAGRTIVPFLTEGEEGFTVDYPDDWDRAEAIVARGDARLPAIALPGEAA